MHAPLRVEAFETAGADSFGTAAVPSQPGIGFLVVLTSLAFLAPATLSFRAGRLWHTGVFSLMAAVWMLYNACDEVTGCTATASHVLTLLDYGCAYFCFIQMAFLVLGPEDPVLQWIDHPVVLDTPKCALAMPPRKDVVVMSRTVPSIAFVTFLCFHTSWQDFHWQMTILCEILLLLGCSTFWLHPDRRPSIPKVLIRLRFWRRLCGFLMLPLLLPSALCVAMESADSQTLHALAHLILAGLCVGVILTVNTHGLQMGKEVLDASPQNPIVARVILGSGLFFGGSTVAASLLMDRWGTGEWRWPLVTMPTQQRPGGYVVIAGVLPTLAALGTAFWLIGSTAGSAQDHEAQEIMVSKKLGCNIGYAALLLGLLAAAADGDKTPMMHKSCLVACFCALTMAMLLATLSARDPIAPGSRLRCLLTFASIVAAMSFMMLLALKEQYVPNDYKVSPPMLAASEYASLLLPTLWSLTWEEEVQARWDIHKASWRQAVDAPRRGA